MRKKVLAFVCVLTVLMLSSCTKVKINIVYDEQPTQAVIAEPVTEPVTEPPTEPVTEEQTTAENVKTGEAAVTAE